MKIEHNRKMTTETKYTGLDKTDITVPKGQPRLLRMLIMEIPNQLRVQYVEC